ncbi:MAG: ATPase domain-containing protein, partial [Pseudomonadota bacterium]|nr:ATPase domain-containing protein [Pseudomonadota bacterium]
MAKAKTAYVCNECGAEHTQWQGQCVACNAWNSLTRISLGAAKAPSAPQQFKREGYAGALASVQTLGDISLEEQPRFSTSVGEFDRVLGGGLVPGSAVLIGGNPGAGKSTLLLQVMCKLSQQMETLYVTGEESLQQVAMRAKRLGLPMDKLKMLAETNITEITNTAQEHKPKLIVIDSIQVMHSADIPSAPGSVAQVRECAAYLIQYAK